jgi:hypothetical protein
MWRFEIYASEGMIEKDETPNRPYVGKGDAAVKRFIKSFLSSGDNFSWGVGVSISEIGNCFKRAGTVHNINPSRILNYYKKTVKHKLQNATLRLLHPYQTFNSGFCLLIPSTQQAV